MSPIRRARKWRAADRRGPKVGPHRPGRRIPKPKSDGGSGPARRLTATASSCCGREENIPTPLRYGDNYIRHGTRHSGRVAILHLYGAPGK